MLKNINEENNRKEKNIDECCENCDFIINSEMIENLDVKVEGSAYGIKITQQGIFKDSLGKIKSAVCPECGYIEIYIDDTKKIKKVI